MDTIDQLAKALLILINSGITLRIVFLFITMMTNPDEAQSSKKRIFQAVKWLVVANSVFVIKVLVMDYYLNYENDAPVWQW